MAETAMTVREVATYLNVNEKTVYRLAQKRGIPGFKVVGVWRFRREDRACHAAPREHRTDAPARVEARGRRARQRRFSRRIGRLGRSRRTHMTVTASTRPSSPPLQTSPCRRASTLLFCESRLDARLEATAAHHPALWRQP